MASLVLIDDNGNTIVIKHDVPSSVRECDIVLKNEYIGWKLWSEEDIEDRLAVYCETNKVNIKHCKDIARKIVEAERGVLKHLSDCTEEDWLTIDFAIQDYIRRYYI